jgi:hypothetical protein
VMVPNYEGYSLENDRLLRYKGRIYVLPNNELKSLISSESHSEVYIAHPGIMKMKEDLKPLFFWIGMKVDIAS